jgi:ABC-type uncharacterized transport system ATPase subunit
LFLIQQQSLDDAEAVIHVIKISENELRKQQVSGFYRDIELLASDELTEDNDIKTKERQLEGVTMSGQTEEIFTLLECHVNLDLEGFEDKILKMVSPQELNFLTL